ncbi:NHL repeat-containing protein [Mucilaginibacter frigoritolerans]|uniref:NHL repeat-containing protein n=1 Tax=Mucilaginibacter frigoritolerans TaxID=652788 RepID=A0A562TVD6_9SPHI|nr:hypothetical protein [Mucilaginibacter frigoritolerans]TWI97228.1 NHL repeat-containing protein [Mucilaginibacter frigoritolerans]
MKTSLKQLIVAVVASSFCVCFLTNCSKKHDNPVPSQTITAVVSTFAGNGTQGWATGSGSIASFWNPAGIVFDATSGNLFVSDFGLRQVRKITPDGSVSIFAGIIINSNNDIYRGGALVDGTGTSAAFDSPTSIAIDGSGNSYVLDGNRYLRKITPGGVVSTIMVTVVNSSTPIDYNNWQIRDITADASGNVYADAILVAPTDIIDAQELIYKITADGSASFIAGGKIGFSNGNGAAALFNGVVGMVADASGNLYVTDYGNREIRKITPNGDVTTFAGNINAGYPGGTEYTDGQGTAASFNQPYGITIDKKGNLFVTDVVEERVRKITSTGLVTTIAGTGAYSLINGPGNQATFNDPIGIAVDSNDNLYVLDYNNYVIRKIVISN